MDESQKSCILLILDKKYGLLDFKQINGCKHKKVTILVQFCMFSLCLYGFFLGFPTFQKYTEGLAILNWPYNLE